MTAPQTPAPKKKGTRRNVSNQALYRAIEARLTVYNLTETTTVKDLLDAIKNEWFTEQV